MTPRGNNEEIDCEFIYPDPATAGDVALGALDGESDAVVVPLYRKSQPTLTDEERDAIGEAIRLGDEWGWSETLRGLLERLK